MFFPYRNIQFKKHPEEKWLMVTGELTNASDKNYHAIVFRIILFIKNIPVGNTTVTINGFYAGQTRTFEAQMGELEYQRLIRETIRCEIYPETAY